MICNRLKTLANCAVLGMALILCSHGALANSQPYPPAPQYDPSASQSQSSAATQQPTTGQPATEQPAGWQTRPSDEEIANSQSSNDANNTASTDAQVKQQQQRLQRQSKLSTQTLQTYAKALQQETDKFQQVQKNEVFDNVLKQAMPLTPAQIHELKDLYAKTQRASAATPGIPPKPTSTTEMVNLAPGATPPIVRLSQGFITSLVFVDATGQPWPVAAFDLGNPQAFNIQWNRKNNILMIQAKSAYTYGNLAVKLQGLATPIMVTLIPGQKVVDYRVDMRIQQLGPNAKQEPLGNGLPAQADPALLSLLDGVPPSGATRLQVAGGQAQAWEYKNKLLLRTPMTVLSPGFISTMSSVDGTHAYQLQLTPTILVSDNGQMQQLSIQGITTDDSNNKQQQQ